MNEWINKQINKWLLYIPHVPSLAINVWCTATTL